MIDYLIEIIFDNVSVKKIGKILKDFTSKGKKVANYNLTCDVSEIDWNSVQSIETIFQEHKSFGLFINLKELKKIDICLPKCRCLSVGYLFINMKMKLI